MRKAEWLRLALLAALLVTLVSAVSAVGTDAAAAGETVELSGETIEYDVNRQVSVVTGKPGAPATVVSGELVLSGERLEYVGATGQVRLEGGVRLEQSEPDQFVLTARTLTADLKARTARAEGEVRLVSGKAVATAATAVFESKGRQVTLSGEPEVRSEDNVLRGKEIVFLLAEQKVLARGGSRVTVAGEQAGQKGE